MENVNDLDVLSVTWGDIKGKVETKKSSYEEDKRFWKLVDDDKKNAGGAFIFVVDKDTKLPFVTTYEFSSKCILNGRTQYLITRSRESIGLKDPIAQWWQFLWSEGLQDDSRSFSRKQANIANIFLIADKVTKENNNKLFLWKFGTQLRELFVSVMEDSKDEDKTELDTKYELFNMLGGAFVNLKRAYGGQFYNYNQTTFGILSDERKFSREKLMEFVNSAYSLNEFLQESYYPTYYENLTSLIKFVNVQIPKGEISKSDYMHMFKQFVQQECFPELEDEKQIDEINKLVKGNTVSFYKKETNDNPPFDVDEDVFSSNKQQSTKSNEKKKSSDDDFDLNIDIDF